MLFILFFAPLGSITNIDDMISYGEEHSVGAIVTDCPPESSCELKVSRPSTSPIKCTFWANTSHWHTDEKVVFKAGNSWTRVTINYSGIGVSSTEERYAVPMNISVEELRFGVTRHVLKLIAITIPILALSCVFLPHL